MKFISKLFYLFMFFNIFSCSANDQPKILKKVAKHVDRISDFNESLNKIKYEYDKSKLQESTTKISKKMMDEVKELKECIENVPDTAKVKIPLTSFVRKWTNSELIYQSVSSNDSKEFMSDVNYLNEFLPAKKGGLSIHIIRPYKP